jgi:hypothetical protein
MAETGYIVISDITGYTAFLKGSELEHAEDSLKDLLNLIIEHNKPPLVISRLEGDAVISYAPEGSFLQGQTMVEILENMYVAFREARQRMRLNTTCNCNACQNIPNLDLKFFVHHGTFILQETPFYKELVGNDVNVAHRLLKNNIPEQTGFQAYAAYTEAAVEALGIVEFTEEMATHSEEFADVGEVHLFVQDLQPVWSRAARRRRVFVEPDDALFVVEFEFPAEPPLVWDYLTKPEYRQIVQNSDRMEVGERRAGRMDEGAVYYCAHGSTTVAQMVLDWRPFEYFTYETPMPAGLKGLITLRFVATEAGTKVITLCGNLEGPVIARKAASLIRGKAAADTLKSYDRLRDQIMQELESGESVTPEAATVSEDQVAAAVQASVTQTAT